MKFRSLEDRKGLIMRLKENCVDSTKVMELAFQNILNEIIEHVIEGVCFEAHRAVKLGYFPVNEYIIKEHKLEIFNGEERPRPSPDADIFDNNNNNKKKIQQFSTCPFCKQLKATSKYIRHVTTCRSRPNGSSSLDNTGKTENYENNVQEEDNSDGRKGNDVKKQSRSAPNYDTMTPEQKQDFLLTHCGVVSRYTRRPCCNSLICSKHSKEDKDKVRGFDVEGLPDHLVDGNIDVDTVD